MMEKATTVQHIITVPGTQTIPHNLVQRYELRFATFSTKVFLPLGVHFLTRTPAGLVVMHGHVFNGYR
jgi:hypothetical protein